MRTVLVNPPIRLPLVFAHYPMCSTLGLLTNAAWLRSKGRSVDVLDAFSLNARLTIRDDGEGFRHVGAELSELAAAARAKRGTEPLCVVIAVTMFSDMNRPQENLVASTAEALAEALPGAVIGLADLFTSGMNYFPYDAVAALERIGEASFVLTGEAEPTLPELLDRLERGAALDLPRTAYRDESGAIRFDPTPPEPVLDLDALPLPAFELLDMDHYFSALGDAIEADLVHEYHVVERQLPLMTSRSCPFRCSFCTNQVLALPWRAHSTDYLRRAVRELRARYEPDRLLLLDDNINADKERFRDLVTMLAEEGMAWDAVNGYRADRLDRDMVRAIKAAGNTKITVSAESGDPELLRKSIRKGLKLGSVVKVAKICDEERIPLQVHYILGVPGETRAQVNRTLEFATELFERHGAWPLLQHAIPFPGTRMYRDCEEAGWFVAPPETISGARLEVESIIRTPELEPEEVVVMKRNAQHLHAATQALTYLVVEQRCDCRCLACHCTSSAAAERDATPIEREALTSQLERARFLGGRELLLGGGEPTLRSDLDAVVTEARAMGFERVRLVTNAHGLANPDRAASLVEAGVSGAVVDLHGPAPSVHDAVTRTPGSFKLTVAGVRQLQRLGCVDLEAAVAVTTDNVDALPATARLAVELGLGHVHLIVPAPDTPAGEEGRVPRWKKLRPLLLKALSASGPGTLDVQGLPLCILPERPRALVPSPPWVLRLSRASRAKHALCTACPAFILCGGFFRPEHEALYGITPELSSRRQ